MSSENNPPIQDRFIDRFITPGQREEIFRKRLEIASTILLALATVATAWVGYQSARWGGEQTAHSTAALKAIVLSGHYENLAEQKTNLHVNQFGQYAEAVSAKNTGFADFLLSRFPEPLASATRAWIKTQPLTNADAPSTPFQMAEYSLSEAAQSAHWEEVAAAEVAAAQVADEISDHYLLFTILFASVLFFAGVSGKFGWRPLDLTVLAFGSIVLIVGIIILFTYPIV